MGGHRRGADRETPPIDGGEFAWPSGIKLGLEVRDVLSPKDYCADAKDDDGDPYCEAWEEPTDPVVVIDYEVTVPDDFQGRFDASMSCPGSLRPMNGNPDAVKGFSGGYASQVEGMMPGSTQQGVVEFAIPAEQLGQEFFLESDCGDTDYAGQWVAFTGTIGDAADATTAAERPEGPPAVRPGDTVTLGQEGSEQVEVTLHSVTYPAPKAADQPARGRVFVALEMRIEDVAGEGAYGVTVYPNFTSDSGESIEDTGWAIGMDGIYGSGDYAEELPDTVPAGNTVQGWSLYEIPPEAGQLEFPYGPGAFSVPVDPTGG